MCTAVSGENLSAVLEGKQLFSFTGVSRALIFPFQPQLFQLNFPAHFHLFLQPSSRSHYLLTISNSDSFYEYLIKHHILFPDDEDYYDLWTMFRTSYSGVFYDNRLGDWYGDVDMMGGRQSGIKQVFESLMAFWPGMQVLLGELNPAARSTNAFSLVREFLGLLPERFNFGEWRVDGGGGVSPLRPELLERISCTWQLSASMLMGTIPKITPHTNPHRQGGNGHPILRSAHWTSGQERIVPLMPPSRPSTTEQQDPSWLIFYNRQAASRWERRALDQAMRI